MWLELGLFVTDAASGTVIVTSSANAPASARAERMVQSVSSPGVQLDGVAVLSLASLTVMVVTAPAGPAATRSTVRPAPTPMVLAKRKSPPTNRPNAFVIPRLPFASPLRLRP